MVVHAITSRSGASESFTQSRRRRVDGARDCRCGSSARPMGVATTAESSMRPAAMPRERRSNFTAPCFALLIFCETQQYPVINMIVGGPWLCATPHGSFHNSRGYADRHYFQAAALAELGFMVVIMDSRGTPMRHKAFQTTNYGWIPEGTQADDFRFGLEQLAQRYPQMDLDRVGIYSPTGYPGGIDNFDGQP